MESVKAFVFFCLFLASGVSVGYSSATVAKEIPQDAKDEILRLHNYYRKIVSPSAANMNRLVWDEKLAEAALNYTLQCVFRFNGATVPGYSSVWKNHYNTYPQSLVFTAAAAAVPRWVFRDYAYNFEMNRCDITRGECEPYRQIIWAKTTAIGCGAAVCQGIGLFIPSRSLLLNCFYGPGRNAVDIPYIRGTSCSRCSAERPHCVDNLCSSTPAYQPPSAPVAAPTCPPYTTNTITTTNTPDTPDTTNTPVTTSTLNTSDTTAKGFDSFDSRNGTADMVDTIVGTDDMSSGSGNGSGSGSGDGAGGIDLGIDEQDFNMKIVNPVLPVVNAAVFPLPSSLLLWSILIFRQF